MRCLTLLCLDAVVQAVAAPPAPAPRNLVSNVSEVGIRDAPLKPLFPDEPPPPKEVCLDLPS